MNVVLRHIDKYARFFLSAYHPNKTKRLYMNIILINNIELISLPVFHEKMDTLLKRQNNI